MGEESVLLGLDERPERDHYFMEIAIAVRRRAICLGRSVGAVLVLNDRIIATGYNGTPSDMPNCDEHEKGCLRCREPEKFKAGTGYDLCICVHAEQNALLSAARFGTPVEGATIYTTVRPCFGCTKEALQAKIHAIYYLHDWAHPDEQVAAEYQVLQARLPGGVRPVRGVVDPDDQDQRAPLESTGHESEENGLSPAEIPADPSAT